MEKICACGKVHESSVKSIIADPGAINRIGEYLTDSKKVFVISDINTHKAVGEKLLRVLDKAGIAYSEYIFTDKHLAPDEKAVGAAFMHFDHSCDTIIGVGSGVINDICKIVSRVSGRKYIIVATAPSMDGYASASSSMDMDGLKVTLPSKCPDIIIADIDIIKNAPMRMLQSGLGDMLAKYVSICEWRIGHIVTGEYYCEHIAELVRTALKKCIDNASGLLKRDENAVKAVFDGLVLGGAAMEYAGVSRPASGVEHYMSHMWDMRALAFGTKSDLHGIQCAIATRTAVKIYEQLKNIVPNREKALKFVKDFDFGAWSKTLWEFIGSGAESMVAHEKTEKKYDLDTHRERLDKIIENWDDILKS